MNKICDVCFKKGVYKCPTCLIFYCSLNCCKKHRALKCDVVKFDSDDEEQVERKRKKDNNYHASERDSDLMKNSEQFSLLGSNIPRSLPIPIVQTKKVEEILEKPEQEPIFEGDMLKVVEPQIEDDEPQSNENTL